MKSLTTVIEVLESCQNVAIECFECPMRHETECEVKSVALAYLKEYQSTKDEDNPVLTWEQLKTMEGKPVWVEKKHSKIYHMWGLVARIKRYQGHEYAVIKCPDLCNSSMSNIRLYDTMYLNDGWQAYRKERK